MLQSKNSQARAIGGSGVSDQYISRCISEICFFVATVGLRKLIHLLASVDQTPTRPILTAHRNPPGLVVDVGITVVDAC